MNFFNGVDIILFNNKSSMHKISENVNNRNLFWINFIFVPGKYTL